METIEEVKTRLMRDLKDRVASGVWNSCVSATTVPSECWGAACFGDFAATVQPSPRELQSQHDSIAAAREEGAAAERARIAEKLAALKPMEAPYTRLQWAWEQVGEKRMYDKVMRALFGPEKKGGKA